MTRYHHRPSKDSQRQVLFRGNLPVIPDDVAVSKHVAAHQRTAEIKGEGKRSVQAPIACLFLSSPALKAQIHNSLQLSTSILTLCSQTGLTGCRNKNSSIGSSRTVTENLQALKLSNQSAMDLRLRTRRTVPPSFMGKHISTYPCGVSRQQPIRMTGFLHSIPFHSSAKRASADNMTLICSLRGSRV